MSHYNLNGLTAPTLQTPTSTFTQEQVRKIEYNFVFLYEIISILVKYSIFSIYAIC